MAADIRALGKCNHKFSNWATTYSCSPELYFEPETEEEIKHIISYAQEKGKKVKVVGFGHSPSDIACTTDFMISLNRFSKVLNIDTDTNQVKLQAGCLLSDLVDNVLPQHGLAFSVLGSVANLTAAGVISTGTHGTGAKFGIISSYVVAVDLMKASGEVITVSKSENSDLFSAVVLSLGSLGVILTVTFQVEKAYNLHQRQFPSTLKDVIDNVDTYLSGSDHFRFMWYPFTDNVACYTASRTTKKCQVKDSWFWSRLVGYYLLQVLYWLSTWFPSMTAGINRLYFQVLCGQVEEKVDRSDKVFTFDCLFKQYVTDWAIPKNNIGAAMYELQQWILSTRFPAPAPVEVRFVKADTIWLSPCYQQDSCYINIIMYRPFNKPVEIEPYWSVFEQIMAKHGGKPHWAKAHKYTGNEFKNLYSKWTEFCNIREQMDPNGMFLNANLERVFNKRSLPDYSHHY